MTNNESPIEQFTALLKESSEIYLKYKKHNQLTAEECLNDLDKVYEKVTYLIKYRVSMDEIGITATTTILNGRDSIELRMNEVNNDILKRELSKINDKFNEINNSILKAEKSLKEIDNIKSSLFGFFGIIVGVLAFVFVNFQLFSKASELKIKEMVVFLGISNICLILGLGFFLNTLSIILGQKHVKLSSPIFWISITFSIFLVFSGNTLF